MLYIIKDKRAISVMVGYILLITFGIVMSVMVYNYIKTYVPSDALGCPVDASLMIKESKCDGNQLNITLKNNGKFNLDGFVILGTNSSEQEVGTINITGILDRTLLDGKSALPIAGRILFDRNPDNPLKSNQEKTYVFDVASLTGINLHSIEISPVRHQKEGTSIMYVVCGGSKIREEVNC